MTAAPFKRGDRVWHVMSDVPGTVTDTYPFVLPARSARDWQTVVSWDDGDEFSHASDLLRAVPS